MEIGSQAVGHVWGHSDLDGMSAPVSSASATAQCFSSSRDQLAVVTEEEQRDGSDSLGFQALAFGLSRCCGRAACPVLISFGSCSRAGLDKYWGTGQVGDAAKMHSSWMGAWKAFGGLPELFDISISQLHPVQRVQTLPHLHVCSSLGHRGTRPSQHTCQHLLVASYPLTGV